MLHVAFVDKLLIDSVWPSLEALYGEKKIRALGLANADISTLAAFIHNAKAVKPVYWQGKVSIYSHAVGALGNGFPAHRHTENASLMAYARAHGVAGAAFNVVSAHESHSTILSAARDPHVLAIAAEQGTSPVGVMFAWALQQGFCVLLGSASEEHIHSNIRLTNVRLSETQMTRLSALVTLAESDLEQRRPAFASDYYKLFGPSRVASSGGAAPRSVLPQSATTSSIHRDGFMVVKGALLAETVASLRRLAQQYASRHGATLLGAKDAGGVPGLAVPDLLAPSHAGALRPLLEVPMTSDVVQRALSHAFNGSQYAFNGMCDLQFNRSIHWHRDLLHPPHMSLERHDVWTGQRKKPPSSAREQNKLVPQPGERYGIYRLVVYLQSHTHDDKALAVIPGSHLDRGCTLPCGKDSRGYLESRKGPYEKVQPVVLHPDVGDAVLFDQRIIHRGQAFQEGNQEPRIAIQISFGLRNAFTYEFAEGARQRQRDQIVMGKGKLPVQGLADELHHACDAKAHLTDGQTSMGLTHQATSPLHPRPYTCFPSIHMLGEEVYSLPAPAQKELPQIAPSTLMSGPRWPLCAVVGPSGVLRDSGCGARIDATSGLVFRSFSGQGGLPFGGSKWARDVGSRVDVTLTNGKPRRNKHSTRVTSSGARVADWLRRYSVQTEVTALITDACTPEVMGGEWQTIHRDAKAAPKLRVLPLRNEYLNCLDTVWRQAAAPAAPVRWSSGVALTSIAMDLCERVDVYGFWPFKVDPSGQRVPYHYSDKTSDPPSKQGIEGLASDVHDWSTEWGILNSTSKVRVIVGRCG